MRNRRRLCTAAHLSIGASRVDLLAIDTGLGIQGVPICGDNEKCGRCRRRHCRCE
jgi:hypothetical protein